METIIAGACGLLIGIVGVWTGFRGLRNHAILARWPTTKGRVIERGVCQPNIPSLEAPALRYAPLVRYVYRIGEKEFHNDCIHPKRIQAPSVSRKEWAQKEAESFAEEVTVHYNPEDPSESFLVLTRKRWLYFVVAFCLVVLFATCFYVLPGVMGI